MRATLLFLLAATAATAAVNVTTQRGDNQRTGVNTNENQLTRQNVKMHFGKLWTLFSDSKIMTQPLYVSKLVVPAANAISPAAKAQCPAGCNAVIFGSMNGTVYAYLADTKSATRDDTLVWAQFLGFPRAGGGDIDMWATDDPVWGILGTPAIDLANQVLYAVEWGQDQQYRLFALDLHTGKPKTTPAPVVIKGASGTTQFFPSGPNNTQVHKQRAGLLLENGLLYIAFGGDNSGISGWLFVYDAATLTQKAIWNPDPKPNGGIWMSGTGPIAANGSVYLQTANGNFDNNHNQWGDALLKLQFNGTQVQVQDFFAPCNAVFLNSNGHDMDMGSAAPLLLPNNHITAGGKFGAVYLMARNALGKYTPGGSATQSACNEGPHVLQRVQATHGHIHGTPVFWHGATTDWVYVMGEGDNLKAFPFQNNRLKTGAADVKLSTWKPPKPTQRNCQGNLPDNWMPGGTLTVSSNGTQDGIVWALVPANGDANSFRGVKGMLMAFDADNVGNELFRSQAANPGNDTADSFGLLSRFDTPTVANGKVFVPNSGDKEALASYCGGNRPHTFPANFALVVYGLK